MILQAPRSARAAGIDDTCLPAVIPAGSRRVAVHDPHLADRLADAGATIVHERPDVEIGPARRLGGAAPCAVVTLGLPPSRHEGGAPAVKALRRVVLSTGVRLAAGRAARKLRRLGYADVRILPWDIGHVLALADGPPPASRRRSEQFPRRAVVVGRRPDAGPSLLADVADRARREGGEPVAVDAPSARSGLLVAIGERSVLRVAIGPAAARVDDEVTALGLLRSSGPSGPVEARLPRVLAAGTCGLATWSLESRLDGAPASPPLAAALLDDCVDFLADLHRTGRGAGGGRSPGEDAAVVADACRPEVAPLVRRLGATADAALAGLPRGFGHGDFWHANLLTDGHRLTGVADWDAAGAGRLPFLDLMHLHVNTLRPRGFDNWGPGVVAHLLPWARGGGDGAAARYGARVGVEPAPGTLGALVVAYWLDFVGYQLRSYAQRRAQPVWLHANVEVVANALGGPS